MGQKVNFNKKKTNKLKIIGIAIFGLFILLILIKSIKDVVNSMKATENGQQSNMVYTTVENYNSLESLLAGYDCKVLSKEETSEFYIVNLSFRENLYNGEISNERYFTNICKGVAEYLKYKNFKLIDKSKNIEIEVKCEKPNIVELKINGDVNYFLNQDSKINSKKRDNKTTNFTIQSKELNDLNNGNWSEVNVNFGTKDSSVNGYNIYFDEGIKCKTVARNIFNVVFTEKYNGKIAGNLNASSTKEEVETSLGVPTFKNGDNSYGYLGNDNYIFFDFLNKEVSVYPVVDITEEEENQLKQYIEEMNKTNDIKKFVTDLTGYWLDFDVYDYDSDFVDLRYTLKGIELLVSGSSLKNGIFIYNNYSGNMDIQNIENVYVKGTDFVFDLEKERCIEEKMQRVEQGDFTEEELKEFGIDFSVRFNKMDMGAFSGARFYSRDKSYPDSELDKAEEISSYEWYGNEDQNYLFIYSVNDEGIYVYNCRTRVSAEIIKLTGEIFVESAKDGIIKFTNDGNQQEINVAFN